MCCRQLLKLWHRSTCSARNHRSTKHALHTDIGVFNSSKCTLHNWFAKPFWISIYIVLSCKFYNYNMQDKSLLMYNTQFQAKRLTSIDSSPCSSWLKITVIEGLRKRKLVITAQTAFILPTPLLLIYVVCQDCRHQLRHVEKWKHLVPWHMAGSYFVKQAC